VRQRALGLTALRPVFDAAGLLILADQTMPVCPLDGGALIGRFLLRGSRAANILLDDRRQAAIRLSRGTWLTDIGWGDYVAIWQDPETGHTHVLRAPFGGVPAFHAPLGDAVIVASEVALIHTVKAHKPVVDWHALARHLGQPELRRNETCLAGIGDIRGGFRLDIENNGLRQHRAWAPWQMLDWPQLDEPVEAAARLRDTIQCCVSMQAPCDRPSLLLLSGGLDSAIVAASLKHAGHAVRCLNYRNPGRGGDESSYARQICDTLGIPLEVATPDAADVALECSAAAPLPYPARRGFEQAIDALAGRVADAIGAAVIFDGAGGDNVFYGLTSVAPAADRLLAHGPDARFRALVRAPADLAGSSLLRIMWKSLRCAWRGHPLRGPAPLIPFLSAEAAALIRQEPLHDWLSPPVPLSPAKASMIAMLAPAQGLVESRGCFGPNSIRSPLVTQPVVETCLRVAPDLWFAPGQNRALARRAFADALPAATLTRRSKGSPVGFVSNLFETRRGQIRDLLFGGLLQQQGLLNERAVSHVLADGHGLVGTDYIRMLELVDAEVWARAQT